MPSLFTKLYAYRQREHRQNKENFLTEIFAHCLREDADFRAAFFQRLGIPEQPEELEVETQLAYEEFGRPDVELRWEDSLLLIECKIESGEGVDQLERYYKILNRSDRPQKHLVYLTKYYEHKPDAAQDIGFYQLRWYEVYDLIDRVMHPITQQLKQYLKDEGMDQSREFNHFDLAALQTISGTISKMDEVLDETRVYFHETTGLKELSKYSARSTVMRRDQSYSDVKYITSLDGYTYHLYIGFSWREDDQVYLQLCFLFPKDRSKNRDVAYQKEFGAVLRTARPVEYVGSPGLEFSRPISSFMGENDHLDAMIQQVKSWINQVAELKAAQPEKFGDAHGI